MKNKKKYEVREIGEFRYEPVTLGPGPHKLADGGTIEATESIDAWIKQVWCYEYPAIESGLGWHQKGIVLENPNPGKGVPASDVRWTTEVQELPRASVTPPMPTMPVWVFCWGMVLGGTTVWLLGGL